MKISPTFFAWFLLCLSITRIPAVLADIKDWQDEMDRQAAVVKTVCDELIDTKYPNSDKPNATQESSLKGCDADTFYYGLDGISVNYVQARLCALSSQSCRPNLLCPDDGVCKWTGSKKKL